MVPALTGNAHLSITKKVDTTRNVFDTTRKDSMDYSGSIGWFRIYKR